MWAAVEPQFVFRNSAVGHDHGIKNCPVRTFTTTFEICEPRAVSRSAFRSILLKDVIWDSDRSFSFTQCTAMCRLLYRLNKRADLGPTPSACLLPLAPSTTGNPSVDISCWSASQPAKMPDHAQIIGQLSRTPAGANSRSAQPLSSGTTSNRAQRNRPNPYISVLARAHKSRLTLLIKLSIGYVPHRLSLLKMRTWLSERGPKRDDVLPCTNPERVAAGDPQLDNLTFQMGMASTRRNDAPI